MKFNMDAWLTELPASGKPLPLLSLPSSARIGASVWQLTHDAAVQTAGMIRIADETDAAAAVGIMDLSVEAEAFGCVVAAEKNEVPTVKGQLVKCTDEVLALRSPAVGEKRTGVFIEAAANAAAHIKDRPVLANIIGPFTLVGRLMGVTEALVNCLVNEDFVYAALEKVTPFLMEYALAYKKAGVNGLIMAEPLAGLLSPTLEDIFSAPYVRQIIHSVQDDCFSIIYHNCGPGTAFMTDSLAENGAAAYHFGDAADMRSILETMPSDKPILGNLSPTRCFLCGTPENMYEETAALIRSCSGYGNFVLSSGCDIPAGAKWENICAFFRAAEDASIRKKAVSYRKSIHITMPRRAYL